MGGNSIGAIDPRGLDIWIEGPGPNEPSGHQSVNVGNPNGVYSSYSYGVNGFSLEGIVYRDTKLGGDIEKYKSTTKEQDAAFRALLERQVGKTGIYGYDDICRSWSQRQFNSAPGKVSTPPKREKYNFGKTTPAYFWSTTTTTSSSGSWTSK